MRIVSITPSTCSTKMLPYLSKCVSSLKESSDEVVDLVTTVVSDNRKGRQVTLHLELDNYYLVNKNTGFSQMNNVAISEAISIYKPDYILLINDDAWVAKDFFQEFVKSIKHKQPDVIIPLVLNSKGNEIDSFGAEYFLSGFAKTANDTDLFTSIAPASCLLITSTCIKKIKKRYGYVFNPILFFYLEDVEFSIRAQAINTELFKNQDLIAYHGGSKTARDKSYFKIYHAYRNVIWLIMLTWPPRIIIKNIFAILKVQGIAFIKSTARFGLLIYPRMVMSTVQNLTKLLKLRETTMKGYNDDFQFESLFSQYLFRKKDGTGIRL